MLRISEHFHFYNRDDHFYCLEKAGYISHVEEIHPIFFKNNKEKYCLNIQIPEPGRARIESSYYIGLDWIQPWKMPVIVEPKVNSETAKIDHVKMLIEALKEPENLDHLDNLIDIRFEDEWINVDGDKNIQLTPFLLIQFLVIVRSIVRKGLKKDYYSVKKNLQSQIKGKIVVGEQIQSNGARNRSTHTICQYTEFGVDTSSNRYLKYVLYFVQTQLENFQESFKDELIELVRYNLAGFQQVSHVSETIVPKRESNPFYRDYNKAFELGDQLLKLVDHSLSKSATTLQKYPPHWIDMSKLFELYVYKKLREKFTRNGDVIYHFKTHYQELDFIIKTGDFVAVVDAKYKPRYRNGNPSIDDARQLSGYARLNSVYNELEVKNDQLIPIYIVYPSELKTEIEDNESEANFEVPRRSDSISLFANNRGCRASKAYKKIYMEELSLAE